MIGQYTFYHWSITIYTGLSLVILLYDDHLIFISDYKLLPIILYVQCNLSFFPIVFIQAFSICLIIFRLGSPHSAQRDNQIPPPQHFGAKLPKMKRIPKITDKDIKLPNQEALAAAAANLSKCVFFFVEFIKLLKIVGLKIFFHGETVGIKFWLT